MNRTITRSYDQLRTILKCPECRGKLVQSDGETACSSCGIVVWRGALQQSSEPATSEGDAGNHLGSYMGTKDEEHSQSAFNEHSTLRYVKLVSDHIGDDSSVYTCSRLIERVVQRFSLPRFVLENAVLLSRKLLADRKSHRATVPTISAYSLMCACRAGGIHHVSAKSILEVYSDLGHRVTKSRLLRLGMESRVRLPPDDPEGLIVTVLKGLQASPAVMERLERGGIEAGPYFRNLLEASRLVVGEARGKRGLSPRTVAAGSVYVASLRIRPKAFTQREVAETLGMAEFTVREFCSWAHREGLA